MNLRFLGSVMHGRLNSLKPRCFIPDYLSNKYASYRQYGGEFKAMTPGAEFISRNLSYALRHNEYLASLTNKHGRLVLDLYRYWHCTTKEKDWRVNINDFIEAILLNAKSRFELALVIRNSEFP